MHPVVAPPLITCCASALMAAFVLMRRHKDPFHWMLSGFLVGLVIWTGGVLLRLTTGDTDQLVAAVRVVFVGITIASSFWLLTAVSYAEERTGVSSAAVKVGVLSIAALFAMALFTNDAHRLFLRRVDFDTLAEGPTAYVGPLFWAFLAWAYLCVGGGMVLYLRAARGMLLAESRRRGMALALASVMPVATSTIYVFQLLPVTYDLTPMGLAAAVGLIWLTVIRYRLFESLPLAREAVLAHLDDGVVMAGSGGRITSWNPAAARIFESSGIHLREPLAHAIERLAPGFALATGSHRTGDGRLVEITMAAVDASHGEPSGKFAILSDRTEADRIAKIARQNQRLEIVGALAAELAREISEPLAMARERLARIEALGAQVEGSAAASDPKLAEELVDLRAVAVETLEGVGRMQRIVEGMRELSTVDRRGFAPVDLAEVARDACRLAHFDDGAAEVAGVPRVSLELTSVPPVHGDADRLVQVVLNLLVNARHALRDVADPRVEIRTAADDGFVELHVCDNGPGIPDEVRHRVFDPFFTTRGPDEGTGLGLAIAFDIAREHDGVLEERSERGSGACFALRIPAAGAASRPSWARRIGAPDRDEG